MLLPTSRISGKRCSSADRARSTSKSWPCWLSLAIAVGGGLLLPVHPAAAASAAANSTVTSRAGGRYPTTPCQILRHPWASAWGSDHSGGGERSGWGESGRVFPAPTTRGRCGPLQRCCSGNRVCHILSVSIIMFGTRIHEQCARGALSPSLPPSLPPPPSLSLRWRRGLCKRSSVRCWRQLPVHAKCGI